MDHTTDIATKQSALIWDLPLRLFHWAMVLVVFIAAVTGYFSEEWWLDIHAYAGYALGCLLIFRIIWGFIGSYYSRFQTFPLAKQGVIAHIKSLLSFKPKEYSGHNPIGAWMIVILLATLSLLVITGLVLYGGQEKHGPLAGLVSFNIAEFSEEIHESLAGILMAAIAIHVAGVLFETIVLKHALIQAMINGKKQGADNPKAPTIWHTIAGIILFAGILLGGLYLTTTTSQSSIPSVQNEIYKRECSDCHPAYHPSLRLASDWTYIMNHLDDHYGEDATLNAEKNAEITAFLQNNDALSFDTEAAHKIGRFSTPSMRMTDTRYWKKRHHEIDPTSFKIAAVGSKINCNACHQDADSGHFDDAKIKLPAGVKS